MRTCSVCGEPKEDDQFNWKVRARGWRLSTCKECQKEVRRKHYHNNPEPYKRRSIEAKRENYRRFYEWLSQQSCVDCGESDPVVLELDHVRGDKRDHVGKMLSDNRSWKTLLAEMEKCDVVCANCHRRRTARTFGWKKQLIRG